MVKIGYIFLSISFLFYLSLPNLSFPEAPKDALQSNEPADTETPQRRAYFTNLTREEVMRHYSEQMKINIFDFNLPSNRLNYPPEEAQVIIRDQTRSTFLEEISNPFREGIFVNGFEPKDPKDAIFIQGKVWRQKIIIRQVASTEGLRIVLGSVSVLLIPIIFNSLLNAVTDLRKETKKLWISR